MTNLTKEEYARLHLKAKRGILTAEERAALEAYEAAAQPAPQTPVPADTETLLCCPYCGHATITTQKLEDAVTMILRSILHDSENLMSLAVDAAAYYEKNYRDTGYLDGLEAKRREVEKSLANLVKVIESGLISETVTERLVQLEEQKRALNEAIEAENIRAALCEDEHTIKAYFEKFLHADFDNPETRDQVLEYFVDKIYLTDDGLVVTSWYSEDRTEVTWDMLYGEGGNPFVKGEAVKFDCFPFGSTRFTCQK